MKANTSTRITTTATCACIAFLAFGLSSCETMKSVGDAAAKPFKVAAKPLKAVNPARLIGKKKRDKEAAEQGPTEVAEIDVPTSPAPGSPDMPSRNTVTPGAQPAPGTTAGTTPRSTLTLPSHPAFVAPSPTQPVTPTPTPAPEVAVDPPLTSPLLAPEPAPAPTLLEDDGFIQLAPKLPGDEDILPPN